ncbi:cold shock domain-containing protein [Roseateles oligotrophus]|uniref:Cold shock domain-containing protein n=1 Tax=Roseateles oligotrophus TaxID=1769250 RepID=A0ABT2YEW3_9BURK|nr:cold shock domain-containing protein [Roseateles oligotrophus]MCV2368591.1 cold shock domain-containing protein [Roseateles oligotrophus]
MRFEGKLTVWHIERGYGAVMPDQGGQELFIHISAFPAEGPQPVAGERISFEIVTGRNNQKQASRVQRLKSGAATRELPSALAPSRTQGRRAVPNKSQRPSSAYVLLGLVVVAAVFSWLEFSPSDGRHIARLVSSTSTLR